MAEELDAQHNFRAMEWEEAREALDSLFSRIFDLLKSNPTLHALVDGREGEPQTKAGDFAVDYRDGNIRLKMSDGKNLLDIGLSSLGGTISGDQHGALTFETSTGGQHHTNATTTNPGFMSATDKTKLNGLSNATPSNATPASNPLGGTGAAGSSTDYSRADHVHPVTSNTNPAGLGTTAVGTSTQPARADHVHAHGNLAGGTLHAVATTSVDGFMDSADKTKLDRFDGYTSAGASPTPAAGHFALWHDSVNNRLYIVGQGNAGGVKKAELL